jgi:hypothetical protein
METWRQEDNETWSQEDKETRRHGGIEAWRHGHGDIKRKTEAKAIFLNPFTVCSYGNRHLSFVHLLIKKETNGSCPFANGLNGLAHLWIYVVCSRTKCKI